MKFKIPFTNKRYVILTKEEHTDMTNELLRAKKSCGILSGVLKRMQEVIVEYDARRIGNTRFINTIKNMIGD